MVSCLFVGIVKKKKHGKLFSHNIFFFEMTRTYMKFLKAQKIKIKTLQNVLQNFFLLLQDLCSNFPIATLLKVMQ